MYLAEDHTLKIVQELETITPELEVQEHEHIQQMGMVFVPNPQEPEHILNRNKMAAFVVRQLQPGRILLQAIIQGIMAESDHQADIVEVSEAAEAEDDNIKFKINYLCK